MRCVDAGVLWSFIAGRPLSSARPEVPVGTGVSASALGTRLTDSVSFVVGGVLLCVGVAAPPLSSADAEVPVGVHGAASALGTQLAGSVVLLTVRGAL